MGLGENARFAEEAADMWVEGSISIPDAKVKDSYTVCRYWIMRREEPIGTYGINSGRISKLTVKINGQTVCGYDRGWEIEPTRMEARIALCILLNSYN